MWKDGGGGGGGGGGVVDILYMLEEDEVCGDYNLGVWPGRF